MRILSFILAFGFAFAAPNFNATADSSLPGAGAFTYSGSQLEKTTIAHLTLTARGRMKPLSAKEDIRPTSAEVARG